MTPTVSQTILQKMNLTHANSQKQKEFLEVFEELVSQSAVNTILELLPEEKVPQFTSLLNQDATGEKAYLLAKEHIPNLDQELQSRIEKIIAKLTT